MSISCCLSLIITVIATDLFVLFDLTGQPQPTDSGGGAGQAEAQPSPAGCGGRESGEVSAVPVCARPDPSPSLRFQLRPLPAASPHIMKPPSVAPRTPLLPISLIRSPLADKAFAQGSGCPCRLTPRPRSASAHSLQGPREDSGRRGTGEVRSGPGWHVPPWVTKSRAGRHQRAAGSLATRVLRRQPGPLNFITRGWGLHGLEQGDRPCMQ